MQADVDLGVGGAQPGHLLRQYIAGLSVGGGDGERAAVLRAVLFTNALEVAHFAQDHFDALEHMLAGLGDPLQALAVAGKNLYA